MPVRYQGDRVAVHAVVGDRAFEPRHHSSCREKNRRQSLPLLPSLTERFFQSGYVVPPLFPRSVGRTIHPVETERTEWRGAPSKLPNHLEAPSPEPSILLRSNPIPRSRQLVQSRLQPSVHQKKVYPLMKNHPLIQNYPLMTLKKFPPPSFSESNPSSSPGNAKV